MNVELYNTTDDKRVLEKTLSSNLTLNCNFYDECNVLNPKIVVEYNQTVFTKNYCYIPTFNRYYFITNMTVDAGERIILHCSIDVLMSYKTNIKELNVTVTRNEYAEPSWLVDPLYTFCSKRLVEVYPFSNTPFNIRTAGTDQYNFVLVVGGGYGS